MEQTETKNNKENQQENNDKSMPVWKKFLYTLILALLFIGVLFYLSVGKKLGIELGIIPWAIIIGLFVFLYSKIKGVEVFEGKNKDNQVK